MATLKCFKRNPSWADLGSFRAGVDYDDSHSESRRIKRSEKRAGFGSSEPAVLVKNWLIRGLELIHYTGQFHSEWEDGELINLQHFALDELEPFPDYEYADIPWSFGKQRISAIWFHKQRRSLSHFLKTVPSKEYDDWVDNHPDAPRFIIFPDDRARGMTDWYLERGHLETYRSLRISVPLVDSYEMGYFNAFIRRVGDRILLAKDYYASKDALSFLPGELSERYAAIFE